VTHFASTGVPLDAPVSGHRLTCESAMSCVLQCRYATERTSRDDGGDIE